MVAEVVKAANIALGVQAADWRSAITAVGRLLVDSGAIAPGYVEAMIKAVEVKGPYIVVAPGVALPHASPADGVNRVDLGVVRLASPVPFGHSSHDPVDLLFCLCTPDFSSHMGLLVGLTGLLENPAALDELRQAPASAAVCQLLQGLLG